MNAGLRVACDAGSTCRTGSRSTPATSGSAPLGFDEIASAFGIDGAWRLGRRHQVKLADTKLSREALDRNLRRRLKEGVQKAGCSIPCPQQDVHLKQAATAS
jgi:hypothetical protein